MTRRQFAASLLASTALARVPTAARVDRPRRTGRGPSKLVMIVLAGGMDDLYSAAPREASQVASGILPVFAPDDLLAHGELRLGPAWAPLAPYMDRMQVIEGVQVSTVSHDVGRMQLQQMRRMVAARNEPSFVNLVGEGVAPDAPLHGVDLGRAFEAADGRGFADPWAQRLIELHRVANDAALRDEVHDALAAALRSCTATACDPVRAVDFLCDRMRGTALPEPPPTTTRIPPADWPLALRDQMVDSSDGHEFSWARYLLEHDLAPAINLQPLILWDTHTDNHALQPPLNHQLARWVRYLLDELAAIPRPGGARLIDEVGIAILSELGRFPFANSTGGKDHFPQISVTLIGPGLRPGRFGDTGRELAGREVSLATGRPGPGGSLLTLDDIGHTLLAWLGHPAPEAIGYDGRVLEFCLS